MKKRGGIGDNPMLFSGREHNKRFHEKAIRASQKAAPNPTTIDKGNTTTNRQSKDNVQRLRFRQAFNATWSGWNWKDFYLTLLGIRRDSEEE